MNHQEIRQYVRDRYGEIKKEIAILALSDGDKGAEIGHSIAYACSFLHKISSKGSKRARKNELIHRDGLLCQGCGQVFTKRQLTVDHVRPKLDGGSNNLDNLVLLCEPCNSLKGSYLTLSGLRAVRTGHLVIQRNKSPDQNSWSPENEYTEDTYT